MPVAYIVHNDLTRVHVLLVGFCKCVPIWEGSDSSLDESCLLGLKKVEITLCLIGDQGLKKVYYYTMILVAGIPNAMALIMMF